jgi:hypothetical protein
MLATQLVKYVLNPTYLTRTMPLEEKKLALFVSRQLFNGFTVKVKLASSP